jgi:hypothetical protein
VVVDFKQQAVLSTVHLDLKEILIDGVPAHDMFGEDAFAIKENAQTIVTAKSKAQLASTGQGEGASQVDGPQSCGKGVGLAVQERGALGPNGVAFLVERVEVNPLMERMGRIRGGMGSG